MLEFSQRDQEHFARLSGDANPIHMDSVVARRTPAGTMVAHGVHVLLRALEELAENRAVSLENLSGLKVRFARFVPLDTPIALSVGPLEADAVRCRVVVGGTTAVSITLSFGARGAPEPPLAVAPIADGVCHDRSIADLEGLTGFCTSPSRDGDIASAFPTISAVLGTGVVAALMQISRVVGMECPGLHSILSSLSIKIDDGRPGPQGLGFRCQSVDLRFQQVTLEVAGSGIAGEVTAFVRPSPTAVPSMLEAAKLIGPQENAGVRALIVGGSRGLGAATAKLVAAGGGQVSITFAQGRHDALEVLGDIASLRQGAAGECFKLDMRQPVAPQLADQPGPFTHIYYFATPHLRRDASEFFRFYVGGFSELCQIVLARWPGATVFYPSSLAVVDPPADMVEYALGKAAGEALCDQLSRDMPQLRLRCVRLPRVLTDLTATVVPVRAADALNVMLQVVRSMQGSGREEVK